MNNDPIFDGSTIEFVKSFDPQKIDISYQGPEIPYLTRTKVFIEPINQPKPNQKPTIHDQDLFSPDLDLNIAKKIFALFAERFVRLIAFSEMINSLQNSQPFSSVLNLNILYDDELYCARKDFAAEIDNLDSIDRVNEVLIFSGLTVSAELDALTEIMNDSKWKRLPLYSDLVSLFSKILPDVKDVDNNTWLIDLIKQFDFNVNTTTVFSTPKYVQ